MRSLPLMICGALLIGALGVMGVLAQGHATSSRVVVVNGDGYLSGGSSSCATTVLPRSYRTSTGNHRTYRGIYGRDGLALQRNRPTSTTVVNDGGRITTVSEFEYGSPVVRYRSSDSNRRYPSYRSNYYLGGQSYGCSPSWGSTYSPYRVHFGSRSAYPYYRYTWR